MIETIFDHDRLDVYRLAIEYTADSFRACKALTGLHRHARDQWLRASQSIPLNIAEGNGKGSPKDRARFFYISRGSAFECAAIRDFLVATGGLDDDLNLTLKRKLKMIFSMLTRMAIKSMGSRNRKPNMMQSTITSTSTASLSTSTRENQNYLKIFCS